MKELFTEIDIDASAEHVWSVLVDFDRYSEWNPFIVEALGTAEPGADLRVTLAPPGGRAVTLKPTVTEVAPARTLEWLGRLGPRGLFDGRHRFELQDSPNGSRLIQREVFTGVLVPLFARTLDERTVRGFVAMNVALKRRAEQTLSSDTRR
jgi:hypothetical protein